MAKLNLLSKEWCDVVFEGKNKSYGAYKVRSEAGQRYKWAFLFLLVLTTMICFSAYAWYYFSQRYVKMVEVNLLSDLIRPETQMEHDLKALAEVYKHPKRKRQQKNITPQIVKNSEVKDLQKEDYKSTFEDALSVFRSDEVARIYEKTPQHDIDLLQTRINPPLTPVEVVEEMPQFPGGVRALMKWLDKHIIYPVIYSRKKKEGTIIVSFIVKVDGKIENIQVQESNFKEMEYLVCDAIKRMPKWIPGFSKGHPTPVKITLPIEFIAK